MFALALFFMSVYLSDEEQQEKFRRKDLADIFACICLSGSWFKYTLTAPMTLYFVYKKKYKVFGGAILIQIALTIFSAVWLKCSVIDCIVLPILISSRLSDEGFLDFRTFINNTMLCNCLTVVLIVVTCLLVYRCMGIKKQDDVLDLSIITMLLLVSYAIVYHRIYDFFAFVIPGYYCIKKFQLSSGNIFLKIVYGLGIAVSWIILFNDTIIKHIGIILIDNSNSQRYEMLCLIGFYYLLLIVLIDVWKQGSIIKKNNNLVGY